MTQFKINLDNYTNSYYHYKNQHTVKINNSVQDIIEFSKLLEKATPEMKEFNSFLNRMISKSEKVQQNNHTYMQALLRERQNTHKRIDYSKLKIIDKFSETPYSNHISPSEIISNKFVTNETEKALNVSILETKFLAFAKSDIFKVTKTDDNFLYLQEYFALQMSRRENFLYVTIFPLIEWLKKHLKTTTIDIIDYLFIKFYYNKALIQNNKNWLSTIQKYSNSIFQIEYRKVDNIPWHEAKKFNHIPTNSDQVNLALNENHTFAFENFFNIYGQNYINQLLEDNGFNKILKSETNLSSQLYVTLGYQNKLCFIIPTEMTQTTLDKYNFIIHALWDEFMANSTYITLLLSKKTDLDIHFFKKLSKESDVILKNENLVYLYNLSKKFELQIQK